MSVLANLQFKGTVCAQARGLNGLNINFNTKQSRMNCSFIALGVILPPLAIPLQLKIDAKQTKCLVDQSFLG